MDHDPLQPRHDRAIGADLGVLVAFAVVGVLSVATLTFRRSLA
jgi:hypothetical protein